MNLNKLFEERSKVIKERLSQKFSASEIIVEAGYPKTNVQIIQRESDTTELFFLFEIHESGHYDLSTYNIQDGKTAFSRLNKSIIDTVVEVVLYENDEAIDLTGKKHESGSVSSEDVSETVKSTI